MRGWVLSMLVAVMTVGIAALGMGEEPPFDLTGTWAVMQVTSDIVVYPFVGEKTRSTTLVIIVEMVQDGREVAVRETHCLADIDDGTAMVTTEIPEAFLRSIGTVERTAVLEPNPAGWRFILPWGTEVHGARLDAPVNDPLPITADDPRVVDQDGDGKPGITVGVRILGLISGEVYGVQRLWKLLEGTVVTPDLIRGLITWTNEQVTIGASNPFLNTSGDARIDPVRERSYFVAIRVPVGMSCEDLKESWRDLFGR